MLVTLLVVLLTGEVLCQYISHPFGGISYITNRHFQQTVDYSYVAPTGQTVKVKFASSVKPPRAQTSAAPQFSAPRFVFHSAPAPAPLTLNPQQPHFSFFEAQLPPPPSAISAAPQNFRTPASAAPRPESLFVRYDGVSPVQSDKQLQAYNDYLKELADENANATLTTTEFQASDNFGFEPESLSYINFGVK